jgi:hypothetical protein
MDAPHVYELRVEGHLADHWSEWFEGLTIYNDPNGETTLTGLLTDQAALFGVLNKIHDLNLILISVSRVPALTASPIQSPPIGNRGVKNVV